MKAINGTTKSLPTGKALCENGQCKGRLLACLLVVAAATCVCVAGNASTTASAESTIAVDVRPDACRAVGEANIGYSPKWGGITNAGAYVVLSKVVGGVTNTVATLPADEESVYAYTPVAGDPNSLRFIHRVYSSGGVEIGEAHASDVAFGYRSSEGQAFVADSRTNSLLLAVKERKPVALAYSTSWATNAAAVTISAVRLSDRGGSAVATNEMFSASADAEGTTFMRSLNIGWWRLLCRSIDEEGGTLLEYLTDEFKQPGGTMISVW